MHDLLIQSGLSKAQASAYLFLLENGAQSPPAVAMAIDLTRSNAYKVLEQLLQLELVSRDEQHKKVIYVANDPRQLANLLAIERNKLLAQEKATQASIDALRSTYNEQSADISSKVYHGKNRLKDLYQHQAVQHQPIYFIKSRADIPNMGYELMSEIRSLARKHGAVRYGITPDALEAPANPAIDEASNLHRTWIAESDYTAPVEWSVCGNEVSIFVFGTHNSAVKITSPAVAESFRQLWKLLDTSVRQSPGYAKLPQKAGRRY